MTDEKWQEVVERIGETFTIEETTDEPLADGPGRCRAVTFPTPKGKMKLEYIVRPLVLGQHGLGSKRIGGATTVAYEYSDTETTATIKAYRQEDGEWVEVNAEALVGTEN